MEDWRNLPKHLLDSVLDKLSSSIDLLQFKAVCESWCEVLMHDKLKRIEYYDHQVPMLLVPNEKENSWQVYDAVLRKFSKERLNISHKMRFCGSSHGWLASVNHDYTLTLHRPYFGVNKAASTILLPRLPPLRPSVDNGYVSPFEYHVNNICITSNPQIHAKDCIIFVTTGGTHELAFIRYMTDTTWTWITRGSDYEDMMWHNNRLYTVNLRGVLECFEILDDADTPVRKTIVAPSYPGDVDYVFGRRYLAKTIDNEILRVDRHYDYGDNYGEEFPPRFTTKIEVFKLDSHNNQWIKMVLLGDVSLFLGDNSAILVRASDFSECLPNCVYLTQDIDPITCDCTVISDVGVFNLESQKLSSVFGLDPKMFENLVRKPLIWITA